MTVRVRVKVIRVSVRVRSQANFAESPSLKIDPPIVAHQAVPVGLLGCWLAAALLTSVTRSRVVSMLKTESLVCGIQSMRPLWVRMAEDHLDFPRWEPGRIRVVWRVGLITRMLGESYGQQ